MDIKFINQPKELKMGDILRKRLEERFDDAWIISGIVKDSGIEYLFESIEKGISNDIKVHMLIGVDRKNTSKDILLKLLSAGVDLNIHVNQEEDKVETRIYVFESNAGDSYVYLCGGKLSEGGLLENICLITEIRYSIEDKDSFKIFKNQLLQGTANNFKTVDREDIILLAKNGEILSRIIDRKIPSISELYGNKEQSIGEQVYDEGANLGLFNVDDLDNVDIEFDDGIELRKNVELEVEKEAKKDILETTKTEKDLKRLLGKDYNVQENENKKTKIIKDIKEINSENVTTLIIEAGKIAKTGADEGKIRLPKSLATLVEKFLNTSENEDKDIEVEILDNKNGEKYSDIAKFANNGKGISIYSKVIERLDLDEIDIVRILKSDGAKYSIEIIRKDTTEYAIWERYCVNNLKGTSRRYGII